MPFNIQIKEEARQDILTAYQWYEAQQHGLGERFIAALSNRLDDLSQHPDYYSFIAADPENILRDVALNQFPYLVVYEISGNEVIVYAVHATHKKPRQHKG